MKRANIVKCLLMTVFSLIMVGCGASKVDLDECVTLEINGMNGQGRAELYIDDEMIETKIMEALGVEDIDEADIDSYETLQELLEQYDKVEKARHCIEFVTKPVDNLSNNDVVEVYAIFDEEAAKECGVNFEFKEKKITVSNLQDPIIVSEEELLQIVSAEFNGVSPKVELRIVNTSEDEVLSRIKFQADKIYDIKKGDTITINVNNVDEMGNLGVLFEENGIEIIADNVDAPINSIEELSEVQLQEIYAVAQEKLNELSNKQIDTNFYVDGRFWSAMNSFESMSEPRLTTSYFCRLKDEITRSSLGDIENAIAITYKFDLTGMGGGMFEQPSKDYKDCYIMLVCKNVVLTRDGTLKFDDAFQFSRCYNSLEGLKSEFGGFYVSQPLPNGGNYNISEIQW